MFLLYYYTPYTRLVWLLTDYGLIDLFGETYPLIYPQVNKSISRLEKSHEALSDAAARF